ncbi:MAG: MBL fold metallo-hydrolase [candidate division WOR-3 bacterium]
MLIKSFSGFSNTYLLQWKDEVLVIDPGNPYDMVKNHLEGLKAIGIIITHGHFDHYIHLEEYRKALKCPAYINFKDLFLVKDTSWIEEMFGIKIDYSPWIDLDIKEGDLINVGDKVLEVWEIPGHSPGSIALIGENFVISGDLIFENGGVGRTDLPGGNWEELEKSINRILTLPEEYVVYPGHGRPFTIKEAKNWIVAW